MIHFILQENNAAEIQKYIYIKTFSKMAANIQIMKMKIMQMHREYLNILNAYKWKKFWKS